MLFMIIITIYDLSTKDNKIIYYLYFLYIKNFDIVKKLYKYIYIFKV